MEELEDFLVVEIHFAESALWDVDLGLSSGKVDVDLTVDLLAVGGWVEDVADSGSVSEWLVGHVSLLVVVRVGDGDQEFTSGEGIESVVRVSLDVLLVPDLHGLSGGVDLGHLLVDVAVGVHGLPEGLSVLWVVSTRVVLLTSVVEEWDTLGGEGEGKGRLEGGSVVVLVQESGVVVVVDEDSQGGKVLEGTLSVVSVFDLVHALLSSENVLDGVVHWIVEETSEVVLVWTNIVWISVEALSHLEDSRGLSVLSPELSFDFWDGINSDTIEVVLLDQVVDPGLQVLSDVRVVLVKIWQVSESAILNIAWVIPVGDLAVRVVMFGLVEWINSGEVHADWSDVVGDDVNHNPDVLGVCGIDQVLEVLLGSKVRVDLLPVGGPVSVVSTVNVVDDWSDPNGVEAHTLDIVKVVLETFPVTTAVVGKIRASIGRSVLSGKSVSENLINSSFLPGVSVTS